MTTLDRLRNFVLEDLQFAGDPLELTPDFPLVDSQAVDSLGVFALVTFCEEAFDIRIDDEELLPETFATLQAITDLVESKRR